jgi:hypothetical protein
MQQKELNSVFKLSIACGIIHFMTIAVMIYFDPEPAMKYGEAGGFGILVAAIIFTLLWVTRVFEPSSFDKKK